jgi:enterochelin esterase-like enzyme
MTEVPDSITHSCRQQTQCKLEMAKGQELASWISGRVRSPRGFSSLLLIPVVLLSIVACELVSPTSSSTTGPASRTAGFSRINPGPGLEMLSRSYRVKDILGRRAKEKSDIWRDGNELTFSFEGLADRVTLCCGLEDDLIPALNEDGSASSTVWALTARIRDLDRAVITVGFTVTRNSTVSERINGRVWRGPNAPAAPAEVQRLNGTERRIGIYSNALAERRFVWVYLPPNHDLQKRYRVVYLTDGGSVPGLARMLEPAIMAGRVSPVILIGTEPGTSSGTDENDFSRNTRAQEYLPDVNPARFRAHETFFTEELRVWAEGQFGASNKREDRVVNGFSNGGQFALQMALRHPDLYGHAVPISTAGKTFSVSRSALGVVPADFFFVAGTLEPYIKQSRFFSGELQRAGARIKSSEWVSGHDVQVWVEVLPSALEWVWAK